MNKKLTFFFIIQCVVVVGCSAQQSLNWQWAKSPVGNGNQASTITTDINGNIYLAGSFDSIIIFGTDTLVNSFPGTNTYDFFLAKFDPNGNPIWAESFGSVYHDTPADIKTDQNGDIYVCGSYSSFSITFGATTLTNSGPTFSSDIFFVKFDTNGNVLWAKSLGNIYGNNAISIEIDLLNNIYLIGTYDYSISFGTTTLISAGYADIFLAKYNSSGTAIWAKTAGGNHVDIVTGSGIDLSGNVFITGDYKSGTINFGSLTLTNSNFGVYDIFLAKYNPSGNLIWARTFGNSSNEYSYGLTIDLNGNPYITGWFLDDSLVFDSNTIYNNNAGNLFLAKFNQTGNIIWAKSVGGSDSYDLGLDLSHDINNKIYLTASFNSPIVNFDSTVITVPANFNFPMLMVSKLDTSGNLLCYSMLETKGSNAIMYLENDLFNNSFVTGIYKINPLIIGNDSLPLTGTQNIFFAKFDCSTTPVIFLEQTDKDFTVYPNPFSEELAIHSKDASTPLSVTLFDVFGKEILSQTCTTANCRLQTANFSPGVYFVKVNNEIKKVVKIK